jgi:sigma-B regulation protein RsbU (phosphoserine phosphatase)
MPIPKIKPKILLVDDEPNILYSYGRGLRREWDLVTAGSGEDGLKEIREKGPFSVIVADFNMPRMDGITFLARTIEIAPQSVRMMLTGEGDFQIATKAVNEGSIFRFMTKPCSLENLERALRAGYEQYRLLQIEKEAREQEIAIAGEIQQTLLLEAPPDDLCGVDLAALTIPSQGVDGDFIDFFRWSSSRFDVVVGDVMGKGVHAALIGAAARNRLGRIMWQLSRAGETEPPPSRIMHELGADLADQLGQLTRFITMIYARFDMQTRTMTYVDAGHMPTLWYSSIAGKWISLKGKNFPVGIPMIRAIEQQSVEFAAGDSFLFYSDGLFEGRNRDGEMFGDKMLMPLLSRVILADSTDLALQGIIGEFRDFTQRTVYEDDLTMIMVRIRP